MKSSTSGTVNSLKGMNLTFTPHFNGVIGWGVSTKLTVLQLSRHLHLHITMAVAAFRSVTTKTYQQPRGKAVTAHGNDTESPLSSNKPEQPSYTVWCVWFLKLKWDDKKGAVVFTTSRPHSHPPWANGLLLLNCGFSVPTQRSTLFYQHASLTLGVVQ